MTVINNIPAHLIDRDDPVLPSHITPNQVDEAAREYWHSISTTNWTSLEFEHREAIINVVANEIALTWALRTAGTL